MSRTASNIVREVTNRLFPELGCSDGACVFGTRSGMHTNGGCACMRETGVQMRRQLMALGQIARTLAAVNGPAEDE
jgi:hypothetical protein